MTTLKQRRDQVSQMRANFAIEGFFPDPVDVAIQEQYIDGVIGIADLLNYAREFARLASSAKA